MSHVLCLSSLFNFSPMICYCIFLVQILCEGKKSSVFVYISRKCFVFLENNQTYIISIFFSKNTFMSLSQSPVQSLFVNLKLLVTPENSSIIILYSNSIKYLFKLIMLNNYIQHIMTLQTSIDRKRFLPKT